MRERVQRSSGVVETEISTRAGGGRTTRDLPTRPVQRHGGAGGGDHDQVHAAAAHGISESATSLPFMDVIQQSFGEHDVRGIEAHVGGAAAQGTREMGATAYATGNHVAFGGAPDLHTAAHEAAHVVQQRSGVSLYGGVGESGDAYERQADAVADRVVAGGSAADLLGAAPGASGGDQAVQRRADKDAKPEIKISPKSATVKVGKKSKHKMEVTDANGLDKDKMVWGGGPDGDRDVLEFFDMKDKGRGKAQMILKGVKPGHGEASGTLQYEDASGELKMISTPKVRVQVGSHLDAAEADLESIDDRKDAGVDVSEREESTAEQEAMAAVQEAVAKSKGDAGTEVNGIVNAIDRDISLIQSQRNDGYLRAIEELTTAGLNSAADYGPFAQSLAGNLVWALSGLLPLAGPVLAVGRFAAFYAQHKDTVNALVTTAAGTAGAMTAQFASTPSGSGPGDAHTKLLASLMQINGDLCDHLRSRMYLLLVQAAQEVPPEKDADAQAYAAELQSAVRQLLYGDMWEKGLASGSKLSSSGIEKDARNGLLRRFVAPNATIDKKGDVKAGPDASNPDTVNNAIGLMKDEDALNFGEYELVAEQVLAAAAQLGVTVNVDAETLSKKLASSNETVIQVSGQKAYGNIHHLFFMEMMTYDPPFTDRFDSELMTDSLVSIDAVRVNKKHMNGSNTVDNGGQAQSANQFMLDCTVQRFDKAENDYGVAPQEAHKIKYKVNVSHGHTGAPIPFAVP